MAANRTIRIPIVLLCGLATAAFITLKLTYCVDWNWVWVLAPLWIPPATLFLGATGFLGLLFMIALFVTKGKRPRRRK